MFQVVSGQKFCIVSEVGISRSCRNDDAHKSASLDLCPVDTLEVGDCVLGTCGCHQTDNGASALYQELSSQPEISQAQKNDQSYFVSSDLINLVEDHCLFLGEGMESCS